MKTQKHIARHLFGVLLAMAALISWSILPIHSSGQAAQAATKARLTVTGQPASTAVANGRIAFASTQGDEEEIYTMNPDGSDRRRLTFSQNDESNWAPAWSPDGTQIAFVRAHGIYGSPGFRAEIFVINEDGSDQRSLTRSGQSDDYFAWSPDGTQIAFLRNVPERGSRHFQIFTMNADGTNQTRLTDSAAGDGSPSWSPDGTKIAFLRNESGIVVMNADGSDQRVISRQYYSPVSWSPDSSKLVFDSLDQLGLFVVGVDGSNLTHITEPPSDWNLGFGYDFAPAWSPDGSKITFSRLVGCNVELVECHRAQIWVVNADGSNPKKLVDDGAFYPTWSPDGTKIIFDGNRGDMLVMNGDGSEVTNITNTSNEIEFGPSWQLLRPSGCADDISPAEQAFEAGGGTGSVDVRAGDECSWTASTSASWISVTLASGSGNGKVVYSVAANTATRSRTATLIVGRHLFSITQGEAPVRITSASIAGNRLLLFGENFDPGAVILLNGEEQRTRNDDQHPRTTLIGKKTGKRIKSGDTLQVRNPNGTVSQEFSFVGS